MISKPIHRLSLSLALVLLLVATTSAVGTSVGPRTVVEQATQQVLNMLENNAERIQNDPEAVQALVAEIVLPRFDFELMSRFVLGRHWRDASPDQRQAFTQAFRDLLVRTYARALDDYSGEDVRIPPQRIPDDTDRVSVQTEIIQVDGPVIPVNYALFFRDAQWKVFDVTIEGVSLVQNYRAQFGDIARADGLDALIDRVRTGAPGELE